MKLREPTSIAGPYAALVAAALLSAVIFTVYDRTSSDTSFDVPATELAADDGLPGDASIVQAFESGRSGFTAQSGGIVQRILADDESGDRHQRFIVELVSGLTLLVSHNIDLAPRAPVEVGDTVQFMGIYEWNGQGGVIHWTHHDPQGVQPGGWLMHRGRTYR